MRLGVLREGHRLSRMSGVVAGLVHVTACGGGAVHEEPELTPVSVHQGGDGFPDKVGALEGATLGVQGVGSGSDQLTRHVLEMGGLDPDLDVTITSFGDGSDILAAFSRNRIDGFLRSSPLPDQAVVEHGGHYLVSTAAGHIPELAGIIWTGTIVRADFAEQERDSVLAFVTALAKAGQLLERCEDRARAAMRAQTPDLDEELFDTIWVQNRSAFPTTPASAEAGFATLLAFDEMATGERPAVTYAEVVDTSFAEEAAERISSEGWEPDC